MNNKEKVIDVVFIIIATTIIALNDAVSIPKTTIYNEILFWSTN